MTYYQQLNNFKRSLTKEIIMPFINILTNDQSSKKALLKLTPKLKVFLAKKLSCKEIKLKSSEIDINFIPSEYNHNDKEVATIKIQIFAASFPQRVKQQDKICRDVKTLIIKNESDIIGDYVKVWLVLTELGHSF